MATITRVHTATFDHFEKNPTIVPILAIAGGILLVLNSLWNFLSIFGNLEHPIYYTMDAFEIFFGVVLVIEEMPRFCGQDNSSLMEFREKIRTWAKFLEHDAYRGTFYVFLGFLLVLCSPSMADCNTFLGAYMILMGIFNIGLYLRKRNSAASPGQDGRLRAAPMR